MEGSRLVVEVVLMSRSYKKTPVCQDGYGKKSLQWYKRQANKKVRRTMEIPSRKAYRKVYETWIFRDYVFRKTLSQYKAELESNLKHFSRIFGNLDDLPAWFRREINDKYFKWWKKCYYWK